MRGFFEELIDVLKFTMGGGGGGSGVLFSAADRRQWLRTLKIRMHLRNSRGRVARAPRPMSEIRVGGTAIIPYTHCIVM